MCPALPTRPQPSKLFNKVALVNKPFRKIAKTIISQTSGNFYRADLQHGEATYIVWTALWLHAGAVPRRELSCAESWVQGAVPCRELSCAESWVQGAEPCREPRRAVSCVQGATLRRGLRLLIATPCRERVLLGSDADAEPAASPCRTLACVRPAACGGAA